MEVILAVFSAAQTTLALIALMFIGEVMNYFNCSMQRKKIARTGLLILIAVSSVAFHVHFENEELIVDQSGAAIVIATLFGGVIVGAMATFAELSVRLVIGGSAMWADIVGIVLAFLVALNVFHTMMRSNLEQISLRAIIVAGALVGAVEAASSLALQSSPLDIGQFVTHGFGVFGVQLLTALLFGWVLKKQDDHARQMQKLESKRRLLNQSMHEVVGALSYAMALRDRTTAGHEKNVAEFAVAVGKKMGMNEDQLEGLRVISLVHDIGQIQIPAEILTRTRALRPEEFEIIKQHSEAGYEILKDVSFPWPVAETVYQHHENIDGTGYPRGLRDDEILLEAKVIRVCDTLDAMLSHRPFRKACSLEDALSQLRLKAGTEFDAKVVDACIDVVQNPSANLPMNQSK